MLVLLAAYNGGPWIGEQLRSILRQEKVAVRVVLSDDGSTDDTREQVARAAGRGALTVISTAAPTGSAAQNFFSLIRSQPAPGADFIAFADQDDLWEADKLRRACSMLAEHRAAGYSSAVTAFWPDGRVRVLGQARRRTDSDYLFEGAGQGCTFVLSAPFYARVRRFLLAHPRLTRELHYHDWSIYALARAWGMSWMFDRRPSVRYRQHAANDTGARSSAAGVARRLSLIRSGWYRRQVAAIADLCHAAAPDNPTVASWLTLVREPDGASRRWRVVRFCLRGGRRRLGDNGIVVLAACAGWL